jgi:hypothetical protein
MRARCSWTGVEERRKPMANMDEVHLASRSKVRFLNLNLTAEGFTQGLDHDDVTARSGPTRISSWRGPVSLQSGALR